MRRRGHYVPGTGFGPGYDPNRDTQWNANKEAVLHFLDGGYVEIQINGRWRQIEMPERMNFFHIYSVRPGGYTRREGIIRLVEDQAA